MYDSLPVIFSKRKNMMKKQNIIKMIAMTLFASVPFVLSASGPEVGDVSDQASFNETDDRQNLIEELNAILGENIQKFYDVAIIVTDTSDQYAFNVNSAAGSIRDTYCQLRNVMGDGFTINGENSKKIRALIDALSSREGLTEEQKELLGEKLDLLEESYLKEHGTELSPREIEEAPNALVQVNNKEEWTAFLMKRVKKFLEFVLIHPDICEDNDVIKVRKEGCHDVRDPIFWTIRTAEKLGIAFDESALGGLYNRMQRLSTRGDLSENQRTCISNCYVDLKKAIRDDNDSVDDTEDAREELSTLFEEFGGKFLKSAVSQSHWYEDVRQKLLSTLDIAQRKGVEIEDGSFRTFFKRCFKVFNYLDRPKFVFTAGTTLKILKSDIREMLDAISEDQSLRLGDDYTKIRDLCPES
ncbi:MAG: hypothetical protein LW808_001620 [Verrucomicrobiota bacterium]|nr:MAG: hypothetical protein LW808_001620 [Verrucomicrobiota bacterium]